jgi:hypothetical protein
MSEVVTESSEGSRERAPAAGNIDRQLSLPRTKPEYRNRQHGTQLELNELSEAAAHILLSPQGPPGTVGSGRSERAREPQCEDIPDRLEVAKRVKISEINVIVSHLSAGYHGAAWRQPERAAASCLDDGPNTSTGAGDPLHGDWKGRAVAQARTPFEAMRCEGGWVGR